MEIKAQSARALALSLLVRAEKQKQFSNIALDRALEGCTLTDADKRLVSRLFYGVLEKKITLDYRLAQLCTRALCDIELNTLCTLRLGLYQLMFADKIPAHAAINETVALCTKKTSGFVNAVLRAHIRKGEMTFPDRETEPISYLSVRYSVCPELCMRLAEVYGIDKTESILLSLVPPPTTLRINTLKVSREHYLSEGTSPTEISPVGVRICGSVRDTDGFDDGHFFVQDEASQICVEAVDARPGMTVADICACPGSKSFGMAINMQNKGKLYAFDLHQSKLSLILSGAERLGIDIIETARQDGREAIEVLFGTADRVLCDVPCSGFGVLAKKPELRYKNPSDSDALPDIQLAILENACKYLKRGGVLVYSTCTILPEENEQNIKRFLASHPDFSLCPFRIGMLDVPDGQITLLPDEYPTDGFFIAKLIRN